MPSRDAKAVQTAPLVTPTDLEPDAVRDVAGALNVLLADMIALYFKTKNFHLACFGAALSRLPSVAGRAKRSDFRDNGRHCRKGSQDRRHDAAIDWTCQPSLARYRQ